MVRVFYEIANPEPCQENGKHMTRFRIHYYYYCRLDTEDSVHHLELIPRNLETLVRLGDELASLRRKDI